MTATPDSFSTADLEALLKDAPKDITDVPVEETPAEETPEARQKRLIAAAQAAMNDLSEGLEGVDVAQAHKVLIHLIVERFMAWHSKVSVENDDLTPIARLCWARDAGKFQAVGNILDTIGLDEDDFTCVSQ